MTDVPVQIRMVMDSSGTTRALRGLDKEFRKVEQAARTEIMKTEQLRDRGLQTQKRRIVELGNQFKRLGHSIERELQSSVHRGIKRGIERGRKFLSTHRGALAVGALAGGATFARSVASRAQRFAAIPDQASAFQAARQYRERMLQLRIASGGAFDTEALGQRFRAVSERTGMREDEMLAAAARVQERFGAEGMPAFVDSLDMLVDVAQTTGTPLEELAAVAGEVVQQFGLTAEEIPRAIGIIAEAGREGSIEIKDFATVFRSEMGGFVQNLGEGGEQALREFVAASQIAGKVFDPNEAATRLARGTRSLADVNVREKLAERGIEYQGRSLGDVAQQLSRAYPEDLGKELQQIFGEIRSVEFWQAMIAAERRGGDEFATIRNISGEAGIERARREAPILREDPAMKLRKLEADRLRAVNEQFDQVAKATLAVSGPLQQLQDQSVLLTQGFEAATEAAFVFAAASGLKTILSQGPAGDAVSTAGRAAGKIGRGVGVLAAGAAGFQFGSWLNEQFNLDDKINNLLGVTIAGQNPTKNQPLELVKWEDLTREQQRAARGLNVAAENIRQASRRNRATSTGQMEDR